MKIVKEVLLGAFCLGLTILLIIMLRQLFVSGERTVFLSSEKLNNYNKNLAESEITMFEGEEVDGIYVINFIKRHLGDYDSTEVSDLYIYVKTQLSENKYVNNSYFENIQNFTDSKFIKPTWVFKCSIDRDANDVILGVRFIQQ
jgi:hypothetical protein